MTTTDLLIPASVAVVWLLGAVSVWRVSRRRRAAVSKPADYATRHRWQNRFRWTAAFWLNRLPGTCWANLVGWAMHQRRLWDRFGEDDVRQTGTCRYGLDEPGASCYCGKLSFDAHAESALRMLGARGRR